MAKKRILISLSQDQELALADLMKEDLADNYSFYIATLVSNETKRRQEAQMKRSVGRPPKETKLSDAEAWALRFKDDLPKTHNWGGDMIGPLELEAREEISRELQEQNQPH